MCRGNGGSEDCVSESASNDAPTPGDDDSRQQTGSSGDVTDDVTHRRQVAAPAPTAGVLFNVSPCIHRSIDAARIEMKGGSASTVWPTRGSTTAKEQNGPHSMRRRVYVTVGVRPSVRLSCRSTAAAAGLLLSAGACSRSCDLMGSSSWQ